MRSPMGKLRQAIEDSTVNKSQIKDLKRYIEASNTRLIEKALPGINDRDRLIESMASALRQTFEEAKAQTAAEAIEAKRVMRANKRIEKLLERQEVGEAEAVRIQSYQELIREVNHMAGNLLNLENSYVKSFTEMMPRDPFVMIPAETGRHELMNHPLYQLIDFRNTHRLFMDNMEQTENSARMALLGIRAFTNSAAELDIQEPRIDYLMKLLEFVNALQEAYGDVGGLIENAIEMMQEDEKGDYISPWVYLAAVDISSNFEMRGGIRNGLRMSSQTADYPMDPLQNKSVYTSLHVKMVEVITTIFGGLPTEPPIGVVTRSMVGKELDKSAFKALLERMLAADVGFEPTAESREKRTQWGLELTFPEEATRRLGRAQYQADLREKVETERKIMRDELDDKDAYGEVDLRAFEYDAFRTDRFLKREEEKQARVKDILSQAGLEGFETILARAPQTRDSLDRRQRRDDRIALETFLEMDRPTRDSIFPEDFELDRGLDTAFGGQMDPRDKSRLDRVLSQRQKAELRKRIAHDLAVREAGKIRMRKGGEKGRQTQAYLRELKKQARELGVTLDEEDRRRAEQADALMKNMKERAFRAQEAKLKEEFGPGLKVTEMTPEEQAWWDTETSRKYADAKMADAVGYVPSDAQSEFLVNPQSRVPTPISSIVTQVYNMPRDAPGYKKLRKKMNRLLAQAGYVSGRTTGDLRYGPTTQYQRNIVSMIEEIRGTPVQGDSEPLDFSKKEEQVPDWWLEDQAEDDIGVGGPPRKPLETSASTSMEQWLEEYSHGE